MKLVRLVFIVAILSIATSANAEIKIYPGSFCTPSGRDIRNLGFEFSAAGNLSNSQVLPVNCPIIFEHPNALFLRIDEVIVEFEERSNTTANCELVVVQTKSDPISFRRYPMRTAAPGGNIFLKFTQPQRLLRRNEGYAYIGCTIPPSFQVLLRNYIVITTPVNPD